VACLSFAALLFATTGVIIRFLSDTVTTPQVVFYRNVLGLMLFAPILLGKRGDFFRTDKLFLHLFRALAGISAMYAFFYAIAHYSLSHAMLFVYASPVFVPLVALLLIREPSMPGYFLVALVGLVGLLMVFQPWQAHASYEMLFIGMFCTFMSATAFVVVRKLSFTEPPERVVFYFTFFGALLSIVPTWFDGFRVSLFEFAGLAAIAVLTTSAQWLLSKGYSYAPAGQIAPVSYLTVVIAGFYGWYLWGEVPGMMQLAGYVVVFMAVILTVPSESREAAGKVEAQPGKF
jgi:drug/metabolite transporter (DMT)-like permease